MPSSTNFGEKFTFFLVIVSLFSLIYLSESTTFTEYNSTFDLPSVKLANLSLKNGQNKNTETLAG